MNARDQLEHLQSTAAALERGSSDSVVQQAASTLAERRAEVDALAAEQAALEKQLTDSLMVLRGAQRSLMDRAGALVPGIHWLVLGCFIACCLSDVFTSHVPAPWAIGGISVISFGLGLAYERRKRAIDAATRTL